MSVSSADPEIIDDVEEQYFKEEVQKEKELIQDYVKNHPYPSLSEMNRRILNTPNDVRMEWFAEYGKRNHEALSIMYRFITDKGLCKIIGEEIYKRGGFTALKCNYCILRYLSPLSESSNYVIKTWGRMVESYWDGVGEWKS